MRAEFDETLVTGNDMIDSQHKELIDRINQLLESQQEKCDIKKAYYQKMLEHLPAAKIWKLDAAEHKFNRHLFDKLRKEPAFKPAPKK